MITSNTDEQEENSRSGDAARGAGVLPCHGGRGRIGEGSEGYGNHESREETEGACGGAEGSPEERESKEGCVYFIETRDGAFVKIGYTVDLRTRRSAVGRQGRGESEGVK